MRKTVKKELVEQYSSEISLSYYYGIILNEYNEEDWWWEFARVLLKLLLIIVMVVFERDRLAKGLIFLILLWIYYAYLLRRIPFETKVLNT